MNHASRYSLVVPVLPAAGGVKPTRRAGQAVPLLTTSASMVVIRNAVDSLTTRCGAVLCSCEYSPDAVSTRRINVGTSSRP